MLYAYLIKTSAPPVKISSISISSNFGYLNLLDRLFLDWKADACPELAAATFPVLGLRPDGAHGGTVTVECAARKKV